MGFARSDGNVQKVGDFVVLVAFDIVEHKDEPCPLGQRGDGFFQVQTCARFRVPGSAQIRRQIIRGDNAGPSPLARPQVAQHGIDSKTAQPTPKGPVPTKGVNPFPHAHEYLLRHLLCLVRVGQHPEADGIDPPDLLTIERFEGLVVAALHPTDEVGYADGVWRCGFQYDPQRRKRRYLDLAASLWIKIPITPQWFNLFRKNDFARVDERVIGAELVEVDARR